MVLILAYLIAWLAVIAMLIISPYIYQMPSWFIENLFQIKTALMGGLGGILYCLRAIYLNKCVYKRWDKVWDVWYYIRPITSIISGYVSYIFLKAGLLTLQASSAGEDALYGYLAVSFIAGFNVDNFLIKIESVVQSSLGINRSRATEEAEKGNSDK